MAFEKVYGTPANMAGYKIGKINDYLSEGSLAGGYAYQQVKAYLPVALQNAFMLGNMEALSAEIEAQCGAEVLYMRFTFNMPESKAGVVTITDLVLGIVFRSHSNQLIVGSVFDAARSVAWFGDFYSGCKMGQGTAVWNIYVVEAPVIPPPPQPPIVIPSSPWYVSWFKPLIEYMKQADIAASYAYTSPDSVLGKLTASTFNLVKNLAAVPTAATAKDKLPTEKELREYIESGAAFADVSFDKFIELKGDKMFIKWDDSAVFLGQPESIISPSFTDEQKVAKLKEWYTHAENVLTKYHIYQLADGITSLAGANLGIGASVVSMEEAVWKTAGNMGKINEAAFDAAWMPAVQHLLNARWTPMLPSSQQLVEMVVKEVIPLETFVAVMAKQGLNADWSNKIWDAHFIVPAYADMRMAYWRGKIPEDKLDYYLKLFDLDPRYNDVIWKPLLEEIPPYQELVNERVKEVSTQVEFEKGLANWGFKGKWAQNIWDAHFSPAQFIDFLTAMRRKLTVNIPVAGAAPQQHVFGVDAAEDIDVIKQLSVLADYDPRYWDFFATRMYNDPSYRMIMWGFETDSIKVEEIPDLVHRLGLNPRDESWYKNFLVHFQERPWIVKYLTALQAAYIAEAITADDLKSRVKAVPRNEEIANWMIKIADVRKEILAKKPGIESQKLLTDSDLRKAYLLDKIDSDKLKTELMLRGYQLADIELLVELINEEKQAVLEGGMKKGFTIAELFDAMRYEFKSEQEVLTELMLRGMNLGDAEILIKTRKAKWIMGGQVAGGD